MIRLFVVVMFISVALSEYGEVETEVMGWMDKATFSCGPGGVIEISDAYYGGTYKTDCISKTVQSSVEYLCNGLPTCSFSVEPKFIGGDPCLNAGKDFRVKYKCKATSGDLVETLPVCENESVHISCGPKAIIQIAAVFFGRLSADICPAPLPNGEKDFTNLCVSGEAANIVRNRCDGKSACSIKAAPNILKDPCPGTKKYLQVKYSCNCD
ncbi:L-rhamnose-binding lectin CSL3-like [Aethina tumida]|uniref:L-rhamnose-binding lectin CSL3-like n=1 Tax=Aethina tumida TaxID=116153 RepID=UPI00214953D6|nr:L-rhamnose-binding lectin CSL3-like [Aethina tumida]